MCAACGLLFSGWPRCPACQPASLLASRQTSLKPVSISCGPHTAYQSATEYMVLGCLGVGQPYRRRRPLMPNLLLLYGCRLSASRPPSSSPPLQASQVMWEQWAVHGACDAHLPSSLARLWSLRILHQSTRETDRFSILETRSALPASFGLLPMGQSPMNGQRRCLPTYLPAYLGTCHTRFFDNGRDNGRHCANHSRRAPTEGYEGGLWTLWAQPSAPPDSVKRSVIRSRIGHLLRTPRPGGVHWTTAPRIINLRRTPYSVQSDSRPPRLLANAASMLVALSSFRGYPSVVLSSRRLSVVGHLGHNTDTFARSLDMHRPTTAKTASEAFSPVLVIEKSQFGARGARLSPDPAIARHNQIEILAPWSNEYTHTLST